jgi:alcohol dehydrogenase (cytochrome c)
MRTRTIEIGLLVGLALHTSGCQFLRLALAPASVPRPRGESRTDTGPAWHETFARTTPDPAVDWLAYNGDLLGSRYSALAEITVENARELQPVCTFALGERVNMQSGPVAVAGTLYLTTLEQTYAVDAATCGLRWRHRYQLAAPPPFDPNRVNRGVAYLDTPDGPRLFRGANDGRMYALDARTGRELWNVVAGDPTRGETFPAAPIAWQMPSRSLVFIGNAGGDNFGVTGRVMAFDARTGDRVWSADLVPEAGEASASWPATTEVVPKGGGATWSSYTLDTLAGTLYVSTGNAGPDFQGSVRPGANLYTTSVVAIDARVGTVRAVYNLLPHDVHDWDIAAAPSLVTTRTGRALVVAAGKDGHLYAVDRATGATLYTTPVTTIESADAPLTAAGTHFCPGVNGGVEWNGPAYSAVTNALYVGAVDWCTTVELAPAPRLQGRRGLPWTGTTRRLQPFGANDPHRRGWLTAVDAEDGHVLWRYESPTPLVAGVTATAGGLIFTADLHGDVLALDARTGAVQFRHNVGAPVGGGVITYAVDGRQYVAVAAGMHSPTSWKLTSAPATLAIFALPGPAR